MERQPTKEERQWNRQLAVHLDRYGTIREWSDLANWLTKLKQTLSELKQGIAIYDRDSLFKRLASCLNTSLPIALQEQTLECYDFVMVSQLTVQTLPLLCVGLFPFFQSASVRVKQKILDLLKQHLIKIGTQLNPLMSGLVVAILPGLLEMNESLQKNIMSLLDFYFELLSPEIVISSVWSAMLRSSYCRIAGLKYLAAKLMSQGKGLKEDESDDSQDEDANESNVDSITQARRQAKVADHSMTDYMPFKNTLVINTLIACLEDSNSLTIKSSLDFLYKYVSLRGGENVLTTEEKSRLVDSVIMLLIKRDVSTTRKINIWLFGKPDEDNKYNITAKNQGVIQLIVDSLHRHLNDSLRQEALVPLRIILNLYSQHQNLIQRTLPMLSEYLVSFMMRVYCKEQNNKGSNLEGTKIIQRVMGHIGSQKVIILNSLGKKILQNANPIDQTSWLRHLTLLEFFQDKLLKQEEIQENKQLILRILTTMIGTLQNVVNNKKCLQAALNLSLIATKKLISCPRSPQDMAAFVPSFNTYNGFFTDISNKIKSDKSYQKEYQTCILLMIYIYKLVSNIQDSSWVHYLCESVIYDGYFLCVTGGIVKILELGSHDQVFRPLKDQIVQQSRAKKNNYIYITLEKLWDLLSFANHHQKVIPLILKLSKEFPKLLSDVISQSFASYPPNHQELSITKFAIFWRLSGRHKELLSSKELNDLNKLGLFLMLDFLDHQNPLVRHTTKQWVIQSLGDFQRVLDPLLQVLVQPHGVWYKTYQGQLIYTKNFQVNRCVDILKKLKLILLQVTDKNFTFLTKPISENTKGVYDHFSSKSQSAYPTYLEFIFELLVKYLQGKFVLANSLCSVSLIACQLLEIILTTLEDYKVCLSLLKPCIKQILECLHFSIINLEYVNQVQLLNLFKSILFNSCLRRSQSQPEVKTFLKDLMASKLMIQSLVKGLDNESVYIKQRYVEFIILSIPLFLDYHPNSTSLICHFLNVFTSKIIVINSKPDQHENNYQKEEILALLDGIKSIMTYFLDLKIKVFEKQKSQNQTDNGLFSLNSWKSFVSLGLQNRPPGTKVKKNEQIIKQILNDMYQTMLTITECWTVSGMKQQYKITKFGIDSYQSDRFLAFNKLLYNVIGQLETEDSLENYIVRFVRVIFNNYPQQTLNCFVLNWCSNSVLNSRLKILEVLIITGIPLEMFYEVLCQTQIVDRLSKADKKRTWKTPMTIERGSQTSILLLCQAFTHYSHQNFNIFQSQHMLVLWTAFLKLVKLFIGSTNILVVFQLLELFHLFIQKFNPKELLKDQKFKRQLQNISSEIMILVQVATGKVKFVVGEKFGFRFQELSPLPTSVYEVYKKQKEKPVEQPKMSCVSYNSAPAEEKCLEYTRFYCFMVLKRISYDILLNLYTQTQMVLAKKLREYLVLLFPVVEDKSIQNMVLAEKSSEITCFIMEQKQVFLKQFRNDLLQIFNKDDFFICTRRTLQYWARIVDMVIDNNKDIDIFIDYLSRVPSASSFFSKETTETKKKIKSFERICFILYAGAKDKYTNKLEALLQKIVDVIKGTETSQPVLILILFCIRIVILRTSNEALTKLLSDLWPRILFLLMVIFQKEPDGKPGTINLVWAALKLIQLISLTEMSSFNTHEWIFFHDFVNVQLANPGDESVRNSQQNIYSHRPLVQKWLPQSIRAYFTDSTPTNQEQRRQIIIKEDKIDDMELLRAKSLALSQYMIINNSSKSKVDLKHLEQIIEGDFLSLDEFIYKVY